MSDNAITRSLRLLQDEDLEFLRNASGTATLESQGRRCQHLGEFYLAIAVAAAVEQERRTRWMLCVAETVNAVSHRLQDGSPNDG